MGDDNEFFQKLASDFPGGAYGPWYVYAGLIFQAYDHMDMIGSTWEYVQRNTPSEDAQLLKARKLREALLKASVLVGFPKGINACTALLTAITDSSLSSTTLIDTLKSDPSLRSHLQRPEKDARGKAFFSHIYAQHTDRVLKHMSEASGGDLAEFAINAIYGDLMAEERRLNAKETGLLEFLACWATGGSAVAQAKGHMYGAHNLGNGREDILAAVRLCEAIEERLGIQHGRKPEENWKWIAKVEKW